MADQNVLERASKIKLLLLDADGILTDGRIYYGSFGQELKAFDVKDGLGLTLWKKAGKTTCILTAKKSPLLQKRARETSIDKIYQNVFKKINVYRRVKKIFKINDSEIAFMGDDLIDIAVLKEAGFAITVPGSPDEVRANAHYVTNNRGGRGAVREVIELILKRQGLWEKLLKDLNAE